MYSQTFSLDELSRRADLASYILSYWQLKFPQLRNADGSQKTSFTINDEAMVMRIKKLLYVDHLSIEKACERLQEERAFPVMSPQLETPPEKSREVPARPAAVSAPSAAATEPAAPAAAVDAAPASSAEPQKEHPAASVLPTDLQKLMADASQRAVEEALRRAARDTQQRLEDMKRRCDSAMAAANERALAAQSVAEGRVSAAEEEVRRAKLAAEEAQQHADILVKEAQEREAQAKEEAQARVRKILEEAEARVAEVEKAAQRHTEELLAHKNAEIEHLQDVCRRVLASLQNMGR